MPVRLGDWELVAATENIIGEVPLWHMDEQALSWIDILKPEFFRLEIQSGSLETSTPPEKLGSYALTGDSRLLTAGRGGIGLWDPRAGTFDRLSTPETDRPANILNDGRTDRAGRFVVASMDRMLSGPTGRMWQVGPAGSTRLLQDQDIHLPNSLCWSPDGSVFYFGDSHYNMIFAYDYDVSTGDISNRRLFADTSDLPGNVDGSSVDAEGYLWNARYGGSCLIRFSPDGNVDQIVPTPVSQPAHMTFGGPDLKTIYVTTARFRLKPEDLALEPMAGGLLAMEADIAGLPEALYALDQPDIQKPVDERGRRA